jgi:hypothetical protein
MLLLVLYTLPLMWQLGKDLELLWWFVNVQWVG